MEPLTMYKNPLKQKPLVPVDNIHTLNERPTGNSTDHDGIIVDNIHDDSITTSLTMYKKFPEQLLIIYTVVLRGNTVAIASLLNR